MSTRALENPHRTVGVIHRGISRVKRDTAREGISVAPKERRQNVPRLED